MKNTLISNVKTKRTMSAMNMPAMKTGVKAGGGTGDADLAIVLSGGSGDVDLANSYSGPEVS